MPRTITVKGVGRATAKPDMIVISMSLESRHKIYEKAMELSVINNNQLTTSLEAVGFSKDTIKTTNFNVRTDYTSVRGKDGTYRQEFAGYVVSQGLKLQFELDMEDLSNALSAISQCQSRPQITIAFTIEDVAMLKAEMLRSAAGNARRNAEILCEASGVTLGDLIAIEYNWGELDIYSHTRYNMAEDRLVPPMAMGAATVEIEPEDIDVNDSVTFVWEIK